MSYCDPKTIEECYGPRYRVLPPSADERPEAPERKGLPDTAHKDKGFEGSLAHVASREKALRDLMEFTAGSKDTSQANLDQQGKAEFQSTREQLYTLRDELKKLIAISQPEAFRDALTFGANAAGGYTYFGKPAFEIMNQLTTESLNLSKIGRAHV